MRRRSQSRAQTLQMPKITPVVATAPDSTARNTAPIAATPRRWRSARSCRTCLSRRRRSLASPSRAPRRKAAPSPTPGQNRIPSAPAQATSPGESIESNRQRTEPRSPPSAAGNPRPAPTCRDASPGRRFDAGGDREGQCQRQEHDAALKRRNLQRTLHVTASSPDRMTDLRKRRKTQLPRPRMKTASDSSATSINGMPPRSVDQALEPHEDGDDPQCPLP